MISFLIKGTKMTRFILIVMFFSFTTLLTANEYIFSDKEAVQYNLKKYLKQLHPSQYHLTKKISYLVQHEQLIGEPVVVITQPARRILRRVGCQGSAAASCSGSVRIRVFRGRVFRGRWYN